MLTLQTLNRVANLVGQHFGEIPRFHFNQAHEAALAREPYRLGSVVQIGPDGALSFVRLPHADEIDMSAARLRLQPDADPAQILRWKELAEWKGAHVVGGRAGGTTCVVHQGKVWTWEAWDRRKAAFVHAAISDGLVLSRKTVARWS